MSYCRWSCDDCQCDVYVYEDVHGGWVTHVRARRRPPCEPLPPAVDPQVDFNGWLDRRQVVDAILARSAWVSIRLPHAGQALWAATPGECADQLEELRALGYHVPQRAINLLREESAGAGS